MFNGSDTMIPLYYLFSLQDKRKSTRQNYYLELILLIKMNDCFSSIN